MHRRLIAFTLALAFAPCAATAELDEETTSAGAAAVEAAAGKTLAPVRPWAYKRIDRAHDALAAERYGDAIETLDEMRPNPKLNAHERALMWQTYGYAYSSQERYKEAAAAFEQCLEADGLDRSATLQMRYNLAQIDVLLERYDDAIREFREWFAQAPNPSANAYYLYAMAYVQKGEKDEALQLARRAVEKGGREAKEPWLQLVSAILLEQKVYDEVVPVLEQLIVQYPKKTYWLQLSAVYSATDKPDRALAVLELAQRQGMLTQSNELMSLAQLYLYNQIPLKAAEVIEDGLRRDAIPANARTYQLLADSLLHARERERALDPLRRAADLSDNGNAYLRLAQVYLEREDWPQARAALTAAIEKGSLTSPGHAYLLLGVANANEKRWDEAQRAFVTAQDFEPVQTVAASWLQHLASQRASEQPTRPQIAHDHQPKAASADQTS